MYKRNNESDEIPSFEEELQRESKEVTEEVNKEVPEGVSFDDLVERGLGVLVGGKKILGGYISRARTLGRMYKVEQRVEGGMKDAEETLRGLLDKAKGSEEVGRATKNALRKLHELSDMIEPASGVYDSEITKLEEELSYNQREQGKLQEDLRGKESEFAQQKAVYEKLRVRLDEAITHEEEFDLKQKMLDEAQLSNSLDREVSHLKSQITTLRTEETAYKTLINQARLLQGAGSVSDKVIKSAIEGLTSVLEDIHKRTEQGGIQDE